MKPAAGYGLILLVFAGIGLAGMLVFDQILMPWYTRHGEEYEIPDLTEFTFEEAQEVVWSGGFMIVKDKEKYDSNYPEGVILDQNPAPFSVTKRGRRIYVTVSSGEKQVLMPDLVGTSYRDARFLLERTGLALDSVAYEYSSYHPSGVVAAQSFPPDFTLKKATGVWITVSLGNQPSKFVVPRVMGKSLDSARETLLKAGLSVGSVTYELRQQLLPGIVLSQSIRPQEEVPQGSPVDLVVSTADRSKVVKEKQP